MTTLRTAAQQALEVLVRASSYYDTYAEIAALEAALEQPEQDGYCQRCGGEGCVACDARKLPEQEPVAWRNAALRVGEDLCSVGPFGYYNMTAKQWLDWALSVVTVHAPPRREWRGLTEIEICDIEDVELTSASSETFAFARAIEQALKEKNHDSA